MYRVGEKMLSDACVDCDLECDACHDDPENAPCMDMFESDFDDSSDD